MHEQTTFYEQNADRIFDYAEQMISTSGFDVREATMLVFSNTKHSVDRKLAFSENWLQWTLGKFYSPLARTQEASRLVEGGAGDCSERAQILKSIAEQAGYQCSLVGLSGHVVLEIISDEGPWIADADYGYVYHGGLERWSRPEASREIENELNQHGYSEEIIRNYVALVQSTDDNVRCEIGSPISPRLFAIERMCEYLIWAAPLAFIVFGLALLK